VASYLTLPGDTCASLCFSYGTTPRELRYLNADIAPELAKNPIAPGTVVRVPLRASMVPHDDASATRHVSRHSAGTVVLEDHYSASRVTRRSHRAALTSPANDSRWAEDRGSPWRHETSHRHDDDEDVYQDDTHNAPRRPDSSARHTTSSSTSVGKTQRATPGAPTQSKGRSPVPAAAKGNPASARSSGAGTPRVAETPDRSRSSSTAAANEPAKEQPQQAKVDSTRNTTKAKDPKREPSGTGQGH
jgi:hypothetical protein